MAYIPNPIVFGPTPAGGVTLEVTADRGGLAGYILLSVSGPPAVLTLNGQPLTYPVTLHAGDSLTLVRSAGAVLTAIQALAPLDEAAPPTPAGLVVTTDAEGYQTITNADATSDADGYQTIPDTTATSDADGYETVERSTP